MTCVAASPSIVMTGPPQSRMNTRTSAAQSGAPCGPPSEAVTGSASAAIIGTIASHPQTAPTRQPAWSVRRRLTIAEAMTGTATKSVHHPGAPRNDAGTSHGRIPPERTVAGPSGGRAEGDFGHRSAVATAPAPVASTIQISTYGANRNGVPSSHVGVAGPSARRKVNEAANCASTAAAPAKIAARRLPRRAAKTTTPNARPTHAIGSDGPRSRSAAARMSSTAPSSHAVSARRC